MRAAGFGFVWLVFLDFVFGVVAFYAQVAVWICGIVGELEKNKYL